MKDSKHRISLSRYHNLKKYGVTPDQYDAILTAQNHKCKICGVTQSNKAKTGYRSLCVDHDHKTNKVRGLLCDQCNFMLGCAGDNPVILLKGIQYLKGNL